MVALLYDFENRIDDRELHETYELGDEIARGTFGRVLKAHLIADPTQARAVKLVAQEHSENEWENHLVFREVQLLKELRHEYLIQFYDTYQDADYVYIVMEMCHGGDLFDALLEVQKFSETDAARLGGQALLALRYLHSQSIAHRDIKAENFMLPARRALSPIKLVDFGMACKFTPGKMMTELCGSPHHLSPELICQRYTSSADIWAFGVLMFLLMHSRYPFDGNSTREIMMKITTQPHSWRRKAIVSQTCMAFLSEVLAVASPRRLSAREALEHVWMHQTDTSSPSEEEVAEDLPGSAGVAPSSSSQQAVCLSKQHQQQLQEQLQEQQQQPKEKPARKLKLKKQTEIVAAGWQEIAHKKLGATPMKDFLNKAEYLRRASRLMTAPSAPQKATDERKVSMVPKRNLRLSYSMR